MGNRPKPGICTGGGGKARRPEFADDELLDEGLVLMLMLMAALDEEIGGTVKFTLIVLGLVFAEEALGRTLLLRAGNVLFADTTVLGVEVRTIGERLGGNGLAESDPIGGGRPKSNGLFNWWRQEINLLAAF